MGAGTPMKISTINVLYFDKRKQNELRAKIKKARRNAGFDYEKNSGLTASAVERKRERDAAENRRPFGGFGNV